MVASVTVAYNAPPLRLAEQLRALQGEISRIIVVDNGSASPVAQLLREIPGAGENVQVLPFTRNLGVAHGFNAGIAEARRNGARYVLLLDHDSVPEAGMVAALLESMAAARARAGGPVAAVGPRIRDSRDRHELPFVSLGWLRNHHGRCASEEGMLACDFLISSGALVDVGAFDAVGPFDEDLFVDNVDLEWCFRARAKGFRLYGACAAILDHRLGDERRPVLNGLEVVVHSPERLYYMTRNRVALYGRGYMPLKWKIKDFLRALAKFATLMLLVAPRKEYARMSWRGLRDAWAGRRGKLRAGG
ncbi:MAG TPA: glycosyltransferase family 2 protein [Usitatibacter sp.]|nr:glycosyltransferase family 2 protein [Usitatibacter sp.]